MIKRFIRHIRRWNKWGKVNANGKLHHILVLLGIIHSPTFTYVDDLFWRYNNSEPIAVVTDISKDDNGLCVKCKLNKKETVT